MLFERTLKVLGIYPLHIVFAYQPIVILLGFVHINPHVVRNHYQVVGISVFVLAVIIGKDVVDVGIVYEIFREGVFITDGQLQFIVDGIKICSIAQNVAKQGNEERKAAAVDAFEESAFAMCPIQEVESYALVPPEAKIYFFHWHTLKTAPLRVPEKSLHAYKTTEPWSEFKTIEPLPASSLSDLAASLFEVYPIPAKGTLKVEVAEEFIGKTVYLYDMTGKLLLEIVLNSLRTSIDVSFLPSGIYLLKTDKALKKVAIH